MSGAPPNPQPQPQGELPAQWVSAQGVYESPQPVQARRYRSEGHRQQFQERVLEKNKQEREEFLLWKAAKEKGALPQYPPVVYENPSEWEVPPRPYRPQPSLDEEDLHEVKKLIRRKKEKELQEQERRLEEEREERLRIHVQKTLQEIIAAEKAKEESERKSNVDDEHPKAINERRQEGARSVVGDAERVDNPSTGHTHRGVDYASMFGGAGVW